LIVTHWQSLTISLFSLLTYTFAVSSSLQNAPEWILKYFLIVLAIAMVIMPVFWVMPSPAQKRQTRLRAKAMTLGLLVKVCTLPQSHRAQVRQEEGQKGVAYQLRLAGKGWRKLKTAQRLIRLDGDTEFHGDDPRVEAALQQALIACPQSVKALELNPMEVVAYWQERGGEEQVLQIHQQLQSLQDILSAYYKEEGGI
jgi:hypothetical protein